MLTTKNGWAAVGSALLWLAACTPPGPGALLKGERLLDAGRFDDAVPVLEQATQLLPEHAQAWNHLGLAYHGTRRFEDAAKAYARALGLDRNLAVARYNLGCLLLEQGRVAESIRELTTYTGLQVSAEEGWLRLGFAQLRAVQSDAAERSFSRVLQLNPHSAEALNGLGLVHVQRGRHQLASQQFASALREKPGYPPAALNAAIVTHQFLKDRSSALRRYSDYLALPTTNAETRQAVERLVEQLRAELAASTSTSTRLTPTNVGVPPPLKPIDTGTVAAVTSRREVRPPHIRPPPTNPPPVSLAGRPAESPPVTATPPAIAPAQTSSAALPVAITAAAPAQAAPATPPAQTIVAPATNRPPPPPRESDPRYAYRSLPVPKSGDRGQAQRLLQEGFQAQQAFRTAEALELYRKAAKADPSMSEAYYNIGVAAAEEGRIAEALGAYEQSLAINPASLRTRYNFAVTLEKAGYLNDALRELERTAADHPTEVRVHLTLATLYAERRNDPVQAREHYARVLELEPQHPQAMVIRFWLERNR